MSSHHHRLSATANLNQPKGAFIEVHNHNEMRIRRASGPAIDCLSNVVVVVIVIVVVIVVIIVIGLPFRSNDVLFSLVRPALQRRQQSDFVGCSELLPPSRPTAGLPESLIWLPESLIWQPRTSPAASKGE